MPAGANVSLVFTKQISAGDGGDGTQEGPSHVLELSMDKEHSGCLKDPAYLRVIVSDRENPYYMSSTWGALQKTQVGVKRQVKQNISITGSKEVSTSFDTSKIVSYKWIGKPGPNPAFEGKKIIFPQTVQAALMELVFIIEVDIWSLIVNDFSEKDSEEQKVLVVAYQPATELKASNSLVFKKCVAEDDPVGDETGEGTREKPPEFIQILDVCTGDPVPGVKVSCNGKTLVTDQDGKAKFGPIASGTNVVLPSQTKIINQSMDRIANEKVVY